MALGRTYPDDFELLWQAYPKHPTGRSKKEPSFKAFQRAKKDLGFTQSDIYAILENIEERKRWCETWQKGNKYGPEMFSTYFNQHRWNEPFQRIRGATAAGAKQVGLEVTDDDNKRLFALDCQRRGVPVPAGYERYLSEVQ